MPISSSTLPGVVSHDRARSAARRYDRHDAPVGGRSPARRAARFAAVGLASAWLAGCAPVPLHEAANAPVAIADPAESVNRKIFAFNRVLDDYALKPVAKAYGWLPDPVRTGVHNFANNFGEPRVFVNDVLQANAGRSVNTLGRFTVNTTVGLLGIFDVASHLGMPRHDADFGQTFGVWGMANGPIVEMPLFGTANARDATGRVLSFVLDPLGFINNDTFDTIKTVRSVSSIVDGRYEALPLTARLEREPDYYVALRDTVAGQRARFVVQGRVGEIAPQAPAGPARQP